MEPSELFISLLLREKIIEESDRIFDAFAQLRLSEKGLPMIEGQICKREGENYLSFEFIFINNKWRTQKQLEEFLVEREKQKGVKIKVTEEKKDNLSVDLRAFYETLPDNPDDIPKGRKREKLKKLSRELLIEKYPLQKFAFLYRWLNEEEESTINEPKSENKDSSPKSL